MIFRLNSAAGQPLYIQLMEQIRHAVDTGALRPGDQLLGIRTLAEELIVSPNTVAKAYSELEHEGLLELRQGAGAFISARRRHDSHITRVNEATKRVQVLIHNLRLAGLRDDEMRRIFEAELLGTTEVQGKR
jgi:GntR family transcriptional regulator